MGAITLRDAFFEHSLHQEFAGKWKYAALTDSNMVFVGNKVFQVIYLLKRHAPDKLFYLGGVGASDATHPSKNCSPVVVEE